MVTIVPAGPLAARVTIHIVAARNTDHTLFLLWPGIEKW